MSRLAWLTPEDAPGTALCRTVFIPAGLHYEAAFRGAYLILCNPENWEEHGAQTPEACAAAFQDAFFQTLENWEECQVPGLIVGQILILAQASLHAGWLACDGAIYNVVDYPDLYAVLGGNFGGDGVDTFAVPDLRGRVPLGYGDSPGLTSRAVGDAGGEETHSLTEAELALHDHDMSHNHTGSRKFTQSNAVAGSGLAFLDATAGTAVVTVANGSTTGNTGSGDAHENMPPFCVLSFYVYAGV